MKTFLLFFLFLINHNSFGKGPHFFGQNSFFSNIFNSQCSTTKIDLNDNFVKISQKLNEKYITQSDILVLEQLNLFEKCITENSFPNICHIQNDKNKIFIGIKKHTKCSSKKEVSKNKITPQKEEACFILPPKKEVKIELTKELESNLQLALRVAWGKLYSAEHVGTKNDISSRLFNISELNRLIKIVEKYYDHNNLYSSKFTRENAQILFDGLRTQQKSSSILLSSKHQKENEISLETGPTFSEKMPNVASVNKPSMLKKDDHIISIIKPSEDTAHTSLLETVDPTMSKCAVKEDSIINEKMITRINS